MKRERILQVFVGLLGLLYLWPIYPLYTDLMASGGAETRYSLPLM